MTNSMVAFVIMSRLPKDHNLILGHNLTLRWTWQILTTQHTDFHQIPMVFQKCFIYVVARGQRSNSWLEVILAILFRFSTVKLSSIPIFTKLLWFLIYAAFRGQRSHRWLWTILTVVFGHSILKLSSIPILIEFWWLFYMLPFRGQW